jgi:small GTP-binding protein
VVAIRKDLIIKICLIGDKNVGKTSLIQKSIQKDFNKKGKSATYIDIATKKLTINSSKVILQIWILGCGPQFKFLFPLFTLGVSGSIFMYDITNYTSLNNIETWLTTFKESLPPDRRSIPLVMVGGKLDLFKKRVISKRYAEKVARKNHFLKYFECSSQTGQNIDKVFEFLARSILKCEKAHIKNA